MVSVDASGHQATSLSCLESLCYEQISFWVGVVAKNGGRSGRVVAGTPWTRLTASDFVRLLGDRFPMLAVSERQVRYALNRLVDLGLVLREKFWQSECFRSHSWWALRAVGACPDAVGADGAVGDDSLGHPGHPGGAVGACPDAVGADSLGHPVRSVTPVAPPLLSRTATGVTPNLKPLPSSSDLHSNQVIRSELTKGDPGHGHGHGHGVEFGHPLGHPGCPDAPLPRDPALGHGHPVGAIGPHCPVGHSQGGIWARIHALASSFCPDAVDSVSPSGVIVRGRLLRVDDGACAPLR